MCSKILIPKKELVKLYYKQKNSKYKIGKIYGCSFKTVLNRMREFGMEPLSRSVIQSKYKKKDFSGNKCEKAYLIGFRIGDLNVYQTTSHSDVIIVRCHSTRIEQIQLIKNIFKKYGKVSVSKNVKKNSYHVNCFLNKSFEFLLPKKDDVKKWITKNDNYSKHFAAGYIDAEANIGVYDKRARFKIDSYDKNIINWFFQWFKTKNICCPKPKRIANKNQIYNKINNEKYNNDLWRIRVSIKESLKVLFENINPCLKHKKRIKDLEKCIKNLDDRKQHKKN